MGKRIYCNIKDFEEKDFNILKQLGFSTVERGILAYNKNKISLEQLDNIKTNIKLLKSWIIINNSSDSNPGNRNKYQAYIWIKLIKRTEKISLKQLIQIFTDINSIQYSNNKEYKIKYSKLFIERIKLTNLSEDWKDRFIRTVQ